MVESRLFEYGAHWLARRPDTPNLYICWCRPGTRRVRFRSSRTSDLEEAKRELIALVESKQPVAPAAARSAAGQPGTVLVSVGTGGGIAVIDSMCTYVQCLDPELPSLHNAKLALSYWTEFCRTQDIVYVHELTKPRQMQYVHFRREMAATRGRKLSNGTINREFSVLKAALNLAWESGLLAAVPSIYSLPRPPGRKRFLTIRELRALLAECHETHLWRFVVIALMTLQRPSAILGLRVEQVDLENNLIDFLEPGGVQTKKGRPVIRIPRQLRPVLEEAVADSTSGYIIEHRGQRVIKMRRSFPKAVERAGLAKVTPYTLRHTGATLLAAHGVPMRQIAGMLGHTTEETTEIYAKHTPDFLGDATDALDNLFRATVAPQHRWFAWLILARLFHSMRKSVAQFTNWMRTGSRVNPWENVKNGQEWGRPQISPEDVVGVTEFESATPASRTHPRSGYKPKRSEHRSQEKTTHDPTSLDE